MTARPGFTVIPHAVFKGMEYGDFSRDEFEILSVCYFWANRAESYRVDSYSAARVCHFLGLDANDANVKRFERAARSLFDRKIIRRDYYRGKERTYSVWVPSPERFERVGTPAENEVSLYQPNVVVRVGDNVVVPVHVTANKTNDYEEKQSDNVGVDVVDRAHSMSIKDQGSQNPEKENPLPPEGVLPPAPQGEHSDAVGLQSQSLGQRKHRGLDAGQCVALKELALRYAEFTNEIWRFVPDVKHLAGLLRDFSPEDLLYAQANRFNPERLSKNTMAHFFAKSARTVIEAARLKKTYIAERSRFLAAWGIDFKEWRHVIQPEPEPGVVSTLPAKPAT